MNTNTEVDHDTGDRPREDQPDSSSLSSGARPAGKGAAPGRAQAVGAKYALVGVWIIMAGIYSVIMPHKFFTITALQAIFGSQSVLLFLSIAALCTFVVGEFDLSFASVMGLSATIVPVLAGTHHVNVALACLIAVVVGVMCGVLNAFFIVVLGVPSLIVTLGTASLFLGLAELISSSNTVSVSDSSLTNLALHSVLGLPISFFYGLLLVAAFSYLITWTPVGRHMIFVGANREVARLAGISVDRLRAGSYLAAGTVAAVAGVLLVATVGGYDPTGGANYLLPAFAAVLLGTAVVQPGQFNPVGTFLGIYFLQTGVFGLQLLGYTGWVQDAFYGAGLVVAVTLATMVRTRVKTA